MLCWKAPQTVGFNIKKYKKGKFISLKDIIQVVEGRQTPKFDRFKPSKIDEHKYELSFSIITTRRTLDLEASSLIEKNLFIYRLKPLLPPEIFEARTW